MGHDFSSDERYQTDHRNSPAIDAKDKRIAELESALKRSDEALLELVACSSDMLNSRVGNGLYKQCHAALMEAGRALRPRGDAG